MPTAPAARLVLVTGLCALAVPGAQAAASASTAALPTKAAVETLIGQAQAWLLEQQQPSGAFLPGAKYTLGASQLVTQALATKPLAVAASDPRMGKALSFMATFRQADGSFSEQGGQANYCTALALMVYAATGTGDPAHITAAQRYLIGGQNTDPNSPNRGGMGYGSGGKGQEDLSNTSFAIAALRESGVPASDPALQAAVQFLERCQNLTSVNKMPGITNDGGANYAPEESKAAGSFADPATPGQPPAKFASYGSMTYALVSSYIALDVRRDDPRVAAALAWLNKNYTLDANPGMAAGKERQGLFYYYQMMAKTYDVLDATTVDTAKGAADWRTDLFAALQRQAQTATLPGGSTGAYWINSEKRWGEDIPALVTSYSLMALKRIHASLP